MQILVIGRHTEILETVVRLLNKEEKWMASGASSDTKAIRLFDEQDPAIVLLCAGIEEESEIAIRRYCTDKNPSIVIIQHYGGGSGLLKNEILQALSERL